MSIKLTDGTIVPLDFVEVRDSLSTRNNEAVWNALASEVVMLPATLDSVVLDVTAAMQNQRRILGNGEVGVRLQFEIMMAALAARSPTWVQSDCSPPRGKAGFELRSGFAR